MNSAISAASKPAVDVSTLPADDRIKDFLRDLDEESKNLCADRCYSRAMQSSLFDTIYIGQYDGFELAMYARHRESIFTDTWYLLFVGPQVSSDHFPDVMDHVSKRQLVDTTISCIVYISLSFFAFTVSMKVSQHAQNYAFLLISFLPILWIGLTGMFQAKREMDYIKKIRKNSQTSSGDFKKILRF